MVIFYFLPITAVKSYLIGSNINHTMDAVTIPHIFVSVPICPENRIVFAYHNKSHITL